VSEEVRPVAGIGWVQFGHKISRPIQLPLHDAFRNWLESKEAIFLCNEPGFLSIMP